MLCQCGCGHPAPIATMTNSRHGHVAGQPMRFIRGHVGYLKRREMVTEDLWRVEDRGYLSPCWIAVGYRHKGGYTKVQLRGRAVLAHRAMYEQEVGPIAPGMQIDHLCRQRDCMNPEHLDQVTPATNQQRGANAKVTAEIVREIRASTERTGDIADRLGLLPSHITAIRARRLWRDV